MEYFVRMRLCEILFVSFCTIIIVALLTACQNRTNETALLPFRTLEDPVVEFNNLENVSTKPYSWVNAHTILRLPEGKAYSGYYVSKIDAKQKASYGIKDALKNLIDFSPGRILVSGKMFAPEIASGVKIVLSITRKNEGIFYQTREISSFVQQANQWFAFNSSFELTDQFHASDVVYIVAFGNGDNTFYFDDIEIGFE